MVASHWCDAIHYSKGITISMKTSRRNRLLVISGVLAVGAALLPALPAAAGQESIACGVYVETILNGNTGGGNSIARTYNSHGTCGSMSLYAYTNQYGQILRSSTAYSSATGTFSRTYFGAMQRSYHGHNGTSNTLYN